MNRRSSKARCSAFEGRRRATLAGVAEVAFAPADLSPDRLDDVFAAISDKYAPRHPPQSPRASTLSPELPETRRESAQRMRVGASTACIVDEQVLC